ncbi:MAG: HDOD domain-containing protein [Chitinispirillaceae bacterium]
MNTRISTDSFKQRLQSINNLPTLPSVIAKMTELLQNPSTSAEEVGQAIKSDQALASKVLKLVNSAFYGFPGRIGTITHAVVILGFSTVKNIVLTASILDAFRNKPVDEKVFNPENFWIHSIACGAAAQCIARTLGSSEKEECFIAGLIHDIGKIILYQYMPEEFIRTIRKSNQDEKLFFESERELFEITHQEIGSELARLWHLPPHLNNAVAYHHHPSTKRDGYTVTSIVHCADIFVRALDYGNGGDNKIPLICDSVWRNLGLENISLTDLFDNIKDEVEKAEIFFQLA